MIFFAAIVFALYVSAITIVSFFISLVIGLFMGIKELENITTWWIIVSTIMFLGTIIPFICYL